jgi:drug/metabolite transporter (DMT)-like permease
MSKQLQYKVYAAMSVAVLFWGFSFVWSKQVLAIYQPITVIYFRLILSVLLLFTIGLITGKIEKISFKELKSIMLIAFFEPFCYFIGENFGLTHVSSTVASVLVSMIPLVSPLATYFFFKEKVSWQNFAGIVLSIIGVVMVILKDDLGFKADAIGIAFMILAVVSAVAYSIAVIPVAKKHSIYTIISYQNLMGVLFFTPIFFIFDFKGVKAIGFQKEALVPLLQLAFFASTIAFMFFTYGIKHLGVTKANTLANAIPLITAFLSFYLLGERFSILNIIGIFIVVFGLVLSQMKPQRITLRRYRRD